MLGKPKFVVPLLVLTILAVVLAAGFVSNASDQPKKTILIGLQITPASALVQVASEKGFFEKHGLNVEIKEFTAGKFAFQAMLANSVDFSVVGDLPLALAKLNGNEFYVLSGIGENQNEARVLVRDDNSKTPLEYFSKSRRKLATSIGGTPEFSTYLFLKQYQIPASQVEIVPLKPDEMVGALSSGSVDGIAIFEPYVSLAENILPGQTRRFSLPPNVYPTAYLLAGSKSWVDKNPEEAKQLLQALRDAQEFVQSNPEEAKGVVAKRTKFPRDIIDKIWPDFDLRVRISDQLPDIWKEESQWAIETGKAKQQPEPDFSSILRNDLLGQALKR